MGDRERYGQVIGEKGADEEGVDEWLDGRRENVENGRRELTFNRYIG
jgi:hypothetical protein